MSRNATSDYNDWTQNDKSITPTGSIHSVEEKRSGDDTGMGASGDTGGIAQMVTGALSNVAKGVRKSIDNLFEYVSPGSYQNSERKDEGSLQESSSRQAMLGCNMTEDIAKKDVSVQVTLLSDLADRTTESNFELPNDKLKRKGSYSLQSMETLISVSTLNPGMLSNSQNVCELASEPLVNSVSDFDEAAATSLRPHSDVPEKPPITEMSPVRNVLTYNIKQQTGHAGCNMTEDIAKKDVSVQVTLLSDLAYRTTESNFELPNDRISKGLKFPRVVPSKKQQISKTQDMEDKSPTETASPLVTKPCQNGTREHTTEPDETSVMLDTDEKSAEEKSESDSGYQVEGGLHRSKSTEWVSPSKQNNRNSSGDLKSRSMSLDALNESQEGGILQKAFSSMYYMAERATNAIFPIASLWGQNDSMQSSSKDPYEV
ncbi:hypothetical protein BaRGS_00037687 [Batillaria attramentaria]|uniref:Uncharacterized protein n=1 Tax=Batillaria attramentaria TaxID=370345 RepID=A0ABD0J7Z4_9CAEN